MIILNSCNKQANGRCTFALLDGEFYVFLRVFNNAVRVNWAKYGKTPSHWLWNGDAKTVNRLESVDNPGYCLGYITSGRRKSLAAVDCNGPLNQAWTEDNGTLNHPDGSKLVIRK